MAAPQAKANSTHTLRHRPSPSAPAPSPSPSPSPSASHDHHPPQHKHHLAAAAPACIGLVGALVLVAIVLRLTSPTPKLWTKEELLKFNGSDDNLPIFLSILGSVFDVTLGRDHYGLNGRYNHFAGRDATRGFVTGKSTGDDVSDSVRGLSALQIKSVVDWRSFYLRSYLYSGKVVGRYYDIYGYPTKELQQVEKDSVRGDKLLKQQQEEESQIPNCNSRWSEKDGGEVWCPMGYPRLVKKISDSIIKGPTEKRCACFEKLELTKPGLELYGGCPPLSRVCKTS